MPVAMIAFAINLALHMAVLTWAATYDLPESVGEVVRGIAVFGGIVNVAALMVGACSIIDRHDKLQEQLNGDQPAEAK